MIERTFSERMQAAHEGRARQPFFLVANFATGYTGLSLTSLIPSFEYAFPKGGAKRDLPFYACMTNAGNGAGLFEIFRNIYTLDGVSVQRFFGTAQRLTLAAGDTRWGAAGIGGARDLPADWFYYANPLIVREGESLGIRIEHGAANVAVSVLRAVFLSELILKEDETEGKLTEDEIDEITKQILTRRQRTVIAFIDVDLNDAGKSINVALPELDEWAMVLGFASGTATGDATKVLREAYVSINDPNGREWSNDNEPILVSALAALPFDANNTQTRYRKLLTPYLVGPRRENLNFTFSAGNASDPETIGKLAVILRTV